VKLIFKFKFGFKIIMNKKTENRRKGKGEMLEWAEIPLFGPLRNYFCTAQSSFPPHADRWIPLSAALNPHAQETFLDWCWAHFPWA
jgi:hypothetical protein